jgi:hypothetical protein
VNDYDGCISQFREGMIMMDKHKESLEEMTKRVHKEVFRTDMIFWIKWSLWVLAGLIIIVFITK